MVKELTMKKRKVSDKRSINEIIIHCSASRHGITIKDIDRWHKARGWDGCGYNIVIESDGRVGWGRDINTVGAHCKGHNSHSIGICMIGGDDGNKMYKFNSEQLKELKIVIEGIFMTYGVMPVVGHREYNKHKTCPCFNVEEWMEDGMPDKIYKYMDK